MIPALVEQRESVQESIHENIQSQLSRISSSLLTCTTQLTGLVAHCPANSCSQVFDLIHEGFLRLSSYYWLQAPDGDVTEVYCNSSTMQPEYSSCQQLFMFEIVPSGTYTIHLPNGDVTEVYCNSSTMQPEYASCQQLFEFGTVPSGYYIIRISDGAYLEVYCNNETGQSEYNSCSHVNLFNLPSGIYSLRTSDGTYSEVYCNNETGQGEYDSCAHADLFDLPSGTYTIRPSENNSVTVYCNMDNEECGGGVWTRVASYDYTDLSTACPGDWNQIVSPRSCGRSNSDTGSCSSAIFPTSGIQFSSVCGQVIAIQYGIPGAFYPQHVSSQSIDNYYVEGVSITHGSPREHIWTFAGYRSDDYQLTNFLCPCSQPSLSVFSPPSFVGNNYFCDTGASTCCPFVYHHEDPLWDGQGCGGPSTCCSFNNPPWFSTALPEATSDDIEVRICGFQPTTNEDTSIVTLNLFIQ